MRAVADAAPAVREVAAEAREVAPRRARIRIQPARRWPTINARELWEYRGLLYFLVWRDVKVRYAQTILGAGWAILQPVIAMVVFTVIFGYFARIPSDGAPYAVFSLAALVPWSYFSTALGSSANSLILYPNLVTKIYFPRLLIPMSPVFAGLVDFAISFVLLLIILAFFSIAPSMMAVVLVPLLMLIAMMTLAGVGSFLAALNIQFRDVKHITPFLVQIWMYASPIVYPLSLVPERFHILYSLNPMVGVISGFRAVLLGQGTIPWGAILTGLVTSALLLGAGTMYFRRAERRFADVA